MLHVDLWGPYKVKTQSGCTQFVTIVDDLSRFTWVHLIKYKSDAPTVLENFIVYVEKQFKGTVLCLRTDNAAELCNSRLKQFFHGKGVLHQTSCAYIPQQNEVVERKHRHIQETARSLLFQSRIPDQYLGECILCASYLINRMPLSSLHHATPYNMLHNENLDYDLFKPFGCLCYTTTVKFDRFKLDPRAKPCVFVGYPPTQKGFKVLDIFSQKLSVS